MYATAGTRHHVSPVQVIQARQPPSTAPFAQIALGSSRDAALSYLRRRPRLTAQVHLWHELSRYDTAGSGQVTCGSARVGVWSAAPMGDGNQIAAGRT